ncbi:nucleoside transporter 4, putative [Hepatocystis sp. ex Piliocolobus tephrosceles]|nr:nucleoside transporter 4, putative [Hepatocystis sp. ex Piliocolobus tephrosceles]
MGSNINEKSEKIKIRFIFFLLGLVLSLPSHTFVTISSLINGIYDKNTAPILIGIYSASILVASFFQLTFELTSFNAIIWCSIFKTVAYFFALTCICLLKLSKYYLYFSGVILGLLVGYFYSACTKYSLLLNMNVNSYLITGTAMCGFTFFFVNLFTSFFTIIDGVKETYFSTITFSFGFFIIADIFILIYVVYVEITSVYFKNLRVQIEGYKYNNKKKNSDDNINLSIVEHGDGVIKNCTENSTMANIVISDTLESAIKTDKSDIQNKENRNDSIYWNNYKIEKKSIFHILKNKIIQIKNRFNFNNIILGAKLIKYYYACLVPICLTMFASYLIFPHLLPDMLDNTEYEKYFCKFLFQLSNVTFSFIMAFIMGKLNFIKQKYVMIVSVIRLLFIWICYIVVKNKPTNFIYSNIITSIIIILIGASNSIIRNMSFARIGTCFEDNVKKDHYVSVSSSFCSLSYLVSYALAPWFARIIKAI